MTLSSPLHAKLWSLAAFFSTAASTLLMLRFVVRSLPAADAGAVVLAFVFVGYFAFLDLGISQTTSREIAFSLADPALDPVSRQDRIRGIRASQARILFFVICFSIPLGSAAGYLALERLPGVALSSIAWCWCVMVIGAGLALAATTSMAPLVGAHEVAAERKIRVAGALAMIVVASVAARQSTGAVGFGFAYLAQAATIFALSRFWLRKTGAIPSDGQPSPEMIRKMLALSARWVMTSFGALLILQTGSVLAAYNVSVNLVPTYDATQRLAVSMMGFSLIFSAATLPALSRAYAESDSEGLVFSTLRNVRLATIVCVIGSIFLISQSDTIFRTWLGPTNVPSRALVVAFCILVTLEAHHTAFAYTTTSTGRLPFAFPALLAGTLAVAGGYFLSSRMGLEGIAFAAMGAQMITNNWFAPTYTSRLVGIGLRRYLRSVALPVLAVAALCWAVEALLVDAINARAERFLASFLISGVAVGLVLGLDLRTEHRTATRETR